MPNYKSSSYLGKLNPMGCFIYMYQSHPSKALPMILLIGASLSEPQGVMMSTALVCVPACVRGVCVRACVRACVRTCR